MSPANWLTALRLLLVALLWPLALVGQGRLLGLGLLAAGLTDVLDGYLARRLGTVSRFGARLDAVADLALLVSAAAWLWMLHPSLVADSWLVLEVSGGR